MRARWPEVGVVDHTLLKEAEYLTTVSHEFRVRLKKMVEIRGKVRVRAHAHTHNNYVHLCI